MVRGSRPRGIPGQDHLSGLLKSFRLRGFGQGTRNDLPDFESQGFITESTTRVSSSITAASIVT